VPVWSGLPRRLGPWLGSVRLRLTLWSLVLLGVVLSSFSLFVYFRQQRDVQANTVAELQDLGAQIAGYFKSNHETLTRNGIAGLLKDLVQRQIKPDSELVVALVDSHGQVSQRSELLSPGDSAALEKAWLSLQANPKSPIVTQSITPAGSTSPRAYDFFFAPAPFPEFGLAMIAIGLPVDPGGQMARLGWTLLTGSLALLAADLLIGYWLAGRILRPVQAITRAAREIGETDLHRRLALGRADELGELADTFDQMLARLEAAFERQRQFTADASHELRTPLTIVDLETERALAQLRLPEEYQRALAVIQTESSAMARLVNDLLTLARLEPGASPWNPEPLDLSDLTLEVVERLAPLAQSQGAQLAVGELPELLVLGDRRYLAQMLANLIENALQHGQAECARVRVEAGSRLDASFSAGRPLCWVRVADNGPGIAAEHLPHVFDRFYRVDQARTAHGGSGLGLAIVQQIARAHGGRVTVQSSWVPGEGACFEVVLPQVADPKGFGNL
jgi:signal transduction histidine kinase